MKKLIYIFLAFTITGLQSCDDYVDIQPRGNAIVQTLGEIDLLLNYGNTLSGSEFEIIPILINDNIQIFPEQVSAILNARAFYRHYARTYSLDDAFFESAEEDDNWGVLYFVIGRVNYSLLLHGSSKP